jgi:hypothetical protein
MINKLKLGNKRLLELADILMKAHRKYMRRKTKMDGGYNQLKITHECGSPACAMGHYIAAHPRKWSKFIVEVRGINIGMKEFSLEHGELNAIFGVDGCNRAHTAKDAAIYIREFVKQRR